MFRILFIAILCTFSISAQSEEYRVNYQVELVPEQDIALVEMTLEHERQVKSLDFNLKSSVCSQFESDQSLKRKGNRLIWKPTAHLSILRFQCTITHARKSKSKTRAYDAYMNEDWALFRGDDLVPPAKVRAVRGVESKAKLEFILPKKWKAVNTEWERDLEAKPKDGRTNASVFFVDNPERRFDRPTGWMIAGKLGTRRLKLENGERITRIAVSSPADSSLRRMDILTFLQFVWPEFEQAFEKLPPKVLIVGADDPMWRGGLSAGSSFYMHADRPIISENGTSTLLHELFHMVTGIRGEENSDWIAEGLAEYYSIHLLRRAGGLNDDRYERTINALQRWSKNVKNLEHKKSRGPITAKAVLLFIEINAEIERATHSEKNLDALVAELTPLGKVSAEELSEALENILGEPSKALASALKH